MAIDFSNDTVTVQDIPHWEEAEGTPISIHYFKAVSVNYIILLCFLTVGLGVAYFNMNDIWEDIAGIFIGGSILLYILIIFRWIYAYFLVKSKKYLVREHDFIYKSGIILQSTTIVPYIRIQHTEIEEGWLSRLLGLGQLLIYTAGGGGSDLSIPGLPKEDAYRIKNYINQRIKDLDVAAD